MVFVMCTPCLNQSKHIFLLSACTENELFAFHLKFGLLCHVVQCHIYGDTLISTPLCELWRLAMVVRLKNMFFNICKFHLQFWQMCKLFANKLLSLNTYFYSSVWIIVVHCNFDAKNLHSICLRISPQIFAIVQKFALDNFRDQQFCNLLCEWQWVLMVLFTGNALEVEVPPGMVCCASQFRDENIC